MLLLADAMQEDNLQPSSKTERIFFCFFNLINFKI